MYIMFKMFIKYILAWTVNSDIANIGNTYNHDLWQCIYEPCL